MSVTYTLSNHLENGTMCVSKCDTVMSTQGIFFGENPFDSLFSVFTTQVILSLSISWVVYFVLRPLRQPKIVCNIMAGIILGPSVLGRNKTFLKTIFPKEEMLIFNTLSTLGAACYTFIIAVKMDTSIILRMSRNAWTIGLSSYLVPFVAIYFYGYILNAKQKSGYIMELPSLFLSCAFSTTYFPIIAHVMEELDLETTELGRLVMTSAVLIEMLSHVVSVVVIISTNSDIIRSIRTFVMVVAPIIFLFYVVKPVIRQIIKRTPEGKPVHETYVIAVMLGALIMTSVSDYAWGIYLPGAFLMGAIIPDGPPLGATLVEKYELMIMEIFLPLFFVRVGYQTDVSSIKDLRTFYFTLLFIVLCYLAKIVGTVLASVYVNIRLKNAFLLGVILNFKGVFELSIYQIFLTNQAVDKQCYTALVLFSVFSIAFFSPFINIVYKPQARLTNPDCETKYSRTLQSTPLDGELHILTSIYHECNVPGIINLLQASNPNAVSPISAYVIHAIELVGRNTPSISPCSVYGKKLKNSASQQIMRAFSNYSRNSNGLITIHPFIMLAPYKTMDNIICNLAEDRHIPLIIVPFRRISGGVGSNHLLRDFNSRLQANAPCTVGILIEKGSHNSVTMLLDNHFSCNIAVLFIGGDDDREALALAIRMSNNPNVNITLIRSIDSRDSGSDRQQDELLIKEFMEENVNNASVTCEEVIVNDSVQMLDLIQSLEHNYDLVIVGKNPTATNFEKEMIQWMENPELGVIGDILALSDDYSSSKNMSVLVMQHYRGCNTLFNNLYTNSLGCKFSDRLQYIV